MSPSVVMPSGKSPTRSPAASASCTTSLMRAVSRRRSRRMKIVPARSTTQPTSGQSRISLLAMKRVGRTLETAKMSIQDTWLAAIIAPREPASGGAPSTLVATPAMRSTFADHQPTSARRRAGLARGNTAFRIAAPASRCIAMRVQRTARSSRSARALMGDASRVVAAEDSHPVARLEGLGRLLHHGDVLARVEEHGHLDAGELVGRLLDVVAEDAADQRAADGAADLAVAPAHVAARNAADEGAAGAAHAGVVRLDAHGLHAVDHAEAHPLLAARLHGVVVAGPHVVGAAPEHRGERRGAGRLGDLPHRNSSVSHKASPNASRKRRAISARSGRWFWPPRCAILIDPIRPASRPHFSHVHCRAIP